MKNSVSIFLLIVISSISVTGQVHKINLVEQKYQFKEIRAYNIEQVVDARTEQHSIGWVQKGITNKKRLADFELEFENELETFLDRAVLNWDQSTSVLFKFNELKVWEETKMTSEFAYVSLDLEAYMITEDGYKFISSFESSFETRGMDVTSKHETNIIKALEVVLDDLSSIDILETCKEEPAMTLGELKGASKRKGLNLFTY